MKRFKVALITIATMIGLVVVPLAAPVEAIDVYQKACQSAGNSTGTGSICGAAQGDDLMTIIKNVINLILVVLGMIAVIMIIIGGIRYTTSNGDSNQMTSAKNTILYAVIGLIVAILAFPIVNFILDAFSGGGGTSNSSNNGGTGSTIPPTQNPSSGSTGTPTGNNNGGTGNNGGNGGSTGGSTPPPTPTYTYRNGSYAAQGVLRSPGQGYIGVTLTIQNDVVTGTTASNGATDGTSRTYTANFINTYSSQVIGKPLATLNVSKNVSGSTLTTAAFNSAVSSIRTQAHN